MPKTPLSCQKFRSTKTIKTIHRHPSYAKHSGIFLFLTLNVRNVLPLLSLLQFFFFKLERRKTLTCFTYQKLDGIIINKKLVYNNNLLINKIFINNDNHQVHSQ